MISAGEYRIAMSDVDQVQLNFTRPFVWMGEMYEHLLRALGHPLEELVAIGHATPVVDANCNYRRRILHGELVTIRSAITEIRNTSFVVTHRVERNHQLSALGSMRCVWVRTGARHEPAPPPQWLVRAQEGPEFLRELPKEPRRSGRHAPARSNTAQTSTSTSHFSPNCD